MIPTVRGICIFAVFFSVSQPFCCFTLVYEGRFVLCCMEKIEPLACRFVEFDSSVICHAVVHCFDSFLLQDMFLDLQEFAFEGQTMAFTVNVMLTCILYRDTGPGYD